MKGGTRSEELWGSWAFPLAYFGAHLAFIPLLVFLLPRRVEVLVGPDAPLVLSWLLLAGALVASVAHVAAGHWSDRWIVRHGSRRGIIGLGLVALLASFALLGAADSVVQLAGAVVVFQMALNLTFAPLGALLADYTPDASKGSVAGLLNAALPLSSAGIALLAWLFPQDSAAAFVVNGVLAAACVVPLLLLWDFRQAPTPPAVALNDPDASPRSLRSDFALAWAARFLVQLGAAFVMGFLFLLLSEKLQTEPAWAGQRDESNAIALLSLAATCVAVVGAIGGGRLSDGMRARRIPLALAAAAVAVCLALLGSDVAWPLFLIAYALFQLGLSAFLAIDSALVAQLVGASPRRGALLGVMNLANTFPAVVAPAIAVASLETSLPAEHIGQFFTASAAAALLAAFVVLGIRRVR